MEFASIINTVASIDIYAVRCLGPTKTPNSIDINARNSIYDASKLHDGQRGLENIDSH